MVFEFLVAPSVNKSSHSVPIQSQSTYKVKPAINRSHSHPGCLTDLTKEPAEDKPGSPNKCGSDRKTKNFEKVYSKYVSSVCTNYYRTVIKSNSIFSLQCAAPENIHTPPIEGFLFCAPIPPGNSSLVSYFAC